MKSVLSFLVVFSFAAVAQAKISGLPKQLRGPNEDTIQYDMLEEMSEQVGCDLTEDASLVVKFKITEPKLQDAEYAEYKGELSSFVLNAKILKSCGDGKVSECGLKFDLYDERAYEPDRQTMVCR